MLHANHRLSVLHKWKGAGGLLPEIEDISRYCVVQEHIYYAGVKVNTTRVIFSFVKAKI